MIVVERAAPLLTVQDPGRFGYLADGVTHSGPLDAIAFRIANTLVASSSEAAAFEGCLGGARIRCENRMMIAATGAVASLTIDGSTAAPYDAHDVAAGTAVSIEHDPGGAVWYLAVRGGLDVPRVLGSRSTLLSAGIGTGAIRAGARFSTSDDTARPHSLRAVPPSLRVRRVTEFPLCPAPRSDALDDAEWTRFEMGTYRVTHAVSRVGYRFEGPKLQSALRADLASEPACAGAMQLPPEGQPIILMADHPTIAGYPVVGVVPRYALGQLAQCPPGSTVRFRRESLDDAIQSAKSVEHALSKWATGE